MRIVNLTCTDGRKSFYGKAHILYTEQGETLLQSYNTIVCKVTTDGTFKKLWDGYSVTTMRHVNSFLKVIGISGGGKTWWDSLPVSE